MANLNSTMTMSSASNLIGQNVQVSDTDSYGNCYTGKVTSVTKSGDSIYLSLSVTSNGQTTTQKFNYDNVTEINPTTTNSSNGDSSSGTSGTTTS